MIHLGISVINRHPGRFSAEYQAVYDAFITKPSDAVAAEHNIMVEGMITDGDWQTKDIFYITAAQSAVDSLINWINPGNHDLTVVNLAAGQFTQYRGWTGNGVNGYLNTNYNPNADGINYLQDDASAGIYIGNNISINEIEIGVEILTNHMYIIVRFADGNAYIKMNTDTSSNTANADSRGFYVGNRVLSTHQELWKNKVRIINAARNSTGLPNGEIFILARNTGVADNFSTKQAASAFAGGGQTQTNVNNFTDRLETFMDFIGAGVIP